ncbi:response regulator [Pedobacter cryotolerans]|uniref:Response regulator n=1 Tax=Pedobacter cryotolerans TaxID=2571270 RepID=A0A4U1BV11_9SPHI|nr:response regulator [Pedobacter cryotolerans]TKB96158.1 response regulator [Pedobacter cryotolerans]
MKRILIIDDIEAHREVLWMLFDDEGYLVLSKDDPRNLELVIEEFLPDLIVMDIMMGRFNGADICQRIKNSPRYDGIKVLLMTASVVLDKLDLTSTLADAHIAKPFDINHMAEVVKQLMDT